MPRKRKPQPLPLSKPKAPRLGAPNPLVGRGVHWLDENDRVKWQGEVIAHLGWGCFLVQLFSWIVGEPTQQIVVQLTDLAIAEPSTKGRPVFYTSIEAANDWLDRHPPRLASYRSPEEMAIEDAKLKELLQ